LDKGWNPYSLSIYDMKDFKSQNKLWVDAYPNANDIIVLNIFRVTGNVESGKGITLFLIIISWLLGFVALLKLKVGKTLSGLLISIAVLNPVNILQIFTFGLDSQFYSMILILFSLGALLYAQRDRLLVYLSIFIVTVLLINNKLTSIAYFGIFVAFICLCLFFSRKYKVFFQAVTVFLASIAIAVCVFGYHPYITNLKNHGSVFYPVYVSQQNPKDKAYDYSENRPSNHRDDSQVSLLFESLFFTSNGYFQAPKDAARFKMPFTFSNTELNSFIYLSPKEGGFGVLFSGIIVLLVGLISTLAFIGKSFKGKRSDILLASAMIVVVLLSCVINPLNNVARYVPQFWLIIPVIVWLSWRFRHGFIVLFNILILSLVLVNATLIFNVDLNFNISKSMELNTYLHKLSEVSRIIPISVNFAQSEGNQFLLERYGVHYKEDIRNSADFSCHNGQGTMPLLNSIGNSTALACLDSKTAAALRD
jgi:hypothetical protein